MARLSSFTTGGGGSMAGLPTAPKPQNAGISAAATTEGGTLGIVPFADGSYLSMPVSTTAAVSHYDSNGALQWSRTATDIAAGTQTFLSFAIQGGTFCMLLGYGVTSNQVTDLTYAEKIISTGAETVRTVQPAVLPANVGELLHQGAIGGGVSSDIAGGVMTVFFSNQRIDIDQASGSITVAPVYQQGILPNAGATVSYQSRGTPTDYGGLVAGMNPLAHWRFGELSGTTATDTVSGYVGNMPNGVLVGQSGLVAGSSNAAVSFDGSATAYFHAQGLSLGIKTTSILFRMQPNPATSWGTWPTILQITDRSNETRAQIGVNATTKLLEFYKGANTGQFVSSLNLATDTDIHHVGITSENGSTTIYIDGQAVHTGAWSFGSDIVTTDILLSGFIWDLVTHYSISHLPVIVDELAFFGDVLNSAQIASLYINAINASNADSTVRAEFRQVENEGLHIYITRAGKRGRVLIPEGECWGPIPRIISLTGSRKIATIGAGDSVYLGVNAAGTGSPISGGVKYSRAELDTWLSGIADRIGV